MLSHTAEMSSPRGNRLLPCPSIDFLCSLVGSKQALPLCQTHLSIPEIGAPFSLSLMKSYYTKDSQRKFSWWIKSYFSGWDAPLFFSLSKYISS